MCLAGLQIEEDKLQNVFSWTADRGRQTAEGVALAGGRGDPGDDKGRRPQAGGQVPRDLFTSDALCVVCKSSKTGDAKLVAECVQTSYYLWFAASEAE